MFSEYLAEDPTMVKTFKVNFSVAGSRLAMRKREREKHKALVHGTNPSKL